MYPIFFGDPDEPLYGVSHLPEGGAARPTGAVICQPLLHEGTNARRALRGLAESLARTGVHALRFDYYGTGDSAGDGAAADLPRWRSDIGTAIDELKASRGLTDVGLIGLRFGASLAAEVAVQRRDVSFVALWEPVVAGAPHVRELRALQQAWLDYETAERPGARAHATPDEVLGHALTPAMAQAMEALDLLSVAHAPARRVLVVDEGGGAQTQALGRHLQGLGATVDHRRLDGGQVWNRESDGAQAQVPRELLASITEWVVREPQR